MRIEVDGKYLQTRHTVEGFAALIRQFRETGLAETADAWMARLRASSPETAAEVEAVIEKAAAAPEVEAGNISP